MQIKFSPLLILSLTLLFVACSPKPAPAPAEMIIRVENTPEGVADYVWEEPMTDAVDVPPGLDPDGVYYRPGHKEIVEIRQGRWKMHHGKARDPVSESAAEAVSCDNCKDDNCRQDCN